MRGAPPRTSFLSSKDTTVAFVGNRLASPSCSWRRFTWILKTSRCEGNFRIKAEISLADLSPCFRGVMTPPALHFPCSEAPTVGLVCRISCVAWPVGEPICTAYAWPLTRVSIVSSIDLGWYFYLMSRKLGFVWLTSSSSSVLGWEQDTSVEADCSRTFITGNDIYNLEKKKKKKKSEYQINKRTYTFMFPEHLPMDHDKRRIL